MVTFNVDNVAKGSMPEFRFDSKKNLTNLIGIGVEASSANDSVVFSSNNFVAAINTAYDAHLPLVLSPDMLWLVIAQGLSQHINNNAEELRHQFVSHEGKEKIEVFEDLFVKGSAENNWTNTFTQFSDAIKGYIGKKRDLIVGDFSTTGVVERAAHEVVLMEAMQKYFSYECTTLCGIPQITLLGSKEDWANVQTRVRAISEFGLDWWVKELEPIVDEFVSASSGKVNKSFWQNIYKEGGGSGGPYLSGWSLNLFPYLKDYKTNSFTAKNTFSKSERSFGGITTSQLPIGLGKVPFIWNYYDQKFDMEIAAGFTGCTQNEEGAIVPQLGWAVRDSGSHVVVNARFECDDRDYNKQKSMRNDFLAQLKNLGWQEVGYGWGKNMTGILSKEQFEVAKKISGLTVVNRDEDKSEDRY